MQWRLSTLKWQNLRARMIRLSEDTRKWKLPKILRWHSSSRSSRNLQRIYGRASASENRWTRSSHQWRAKWARGYSNCKPSSSAPSKKARISDAISSSAVSRWNSSSCGSKPKHWWQTSRKLMPSLFSRWLSMSDSSSSSSETPPKQFRSVNGWVLSSKRWRMSVRNLSVNMQMRLRTSSVSLRVSRRRLLIRKLSTWKKKMQCKRESSS